MVKPIGAITADTHLAQRAWSRHVGLTGDSYYGLQQIIDYCTNHDLDLILAGDLFDKVRPDPVTVFQMRKQLDRMERQNLGVYYIQGQHELDRNTPWLQSISSWAEHVNCTQFSLANVFSCYGLDWTSADAVQQRFSSIPTNTDILIAHQVWRDLMGAYIGDAECSFTDVPRARLLITGDFHKHLSKNVINKDNNDMLVLSPGPPCMQSINEDPDKAFFVLCDDLTFLSQPLRTRNCFKFTINTRLDLEKFLSVDCHTVCTPQQGVPNYISKNIVNIIYDESIPEIYARLTNAIGNNAHIFLAPIKIKEDVEPLLAEQRRAIVDGGLEACLSLLVPQGNDLYRDVLTLLRSSDPKQQLVDMQKTFMSKGEKHA